MGMDHGLTGYTVRNPTNNRVSDDAVALVQKLPSVGELFLTNGTDFAREFADEMFYSDVVADVFKDQDTPGALNHPDSSNSDVAD